MPDRDETESRLTSQKTKSSLAVAPFRRSSTRGAAELFADMVLGADPSEKLPWWAKIGAGIVAAAGVTAALAWSWFTAHSLQILGPAFLTMFTAFVLLRRGARQREQRLLGEVDQHTETEVKKAQRELTAKVARQLRDEERAGETALLAEWNASNPLGRLIRPYVFAIFLTGRVVRVHTYVCNVYHLSKMLRCTSCSVRFRSRDAQTGQFVDIAAISTRGWSAEIPGTTTRHEVPQPDGVRYRLRGACHPNSAQLRSRRRAGQRSVLCRSR